MSRCDSMLQILSTIDGIAQYQAAYLSTDRPVRTYALKYCNCFIFLNNEPTPIIHNTRCTKAVIPTSLLNLSSTTSEFQNVQNNNMKTLISELYQFQCSLLEKDVLFVLGSAGVINCIESVDGQGYLCEQWKRLAIPGAFESHIYFFSLSFFLT